MAGENPDSHRKYCVPTVQCDQFKQDNLPMAQEISVVEVDSEFEIDLNNCRILSK